MKAARNKEMQGVSVLMAAGGSGLRVGTPVPKQFLPLGNRPMYSYSLELFLAHPSIDRVLLGLSADRIPLIEEELGRLYPDEWASGRIHLYKGGKRRQDTVYRGIELLERFNPRPMSLLVHDAARPFLSREILDRSIAALSEGCSMAVGLPLADTLWRGEIDPVAVTISSVVPREGLFRAQTPQGAPFDSFVSALRKALSSGDPDFTDEAGLLIFGGFPVRIIPGSEENRKVTTPEDYLWARSKAE